MTQDKILEKLKDVPPSKRMKFFNELSKAREVMDKSLLNVSMDDDNAVYIVNLASKKLKKRYKQLIRLYLKPYGIKTL